MFSSLSDGPPRFRSCGTVAASIALHLGLLAAVVFHSPRAIELAPAWLAYGDSAHTYRLTYLPTMGKDAPAEAELTLPREAVKRSQPRISAAKPPAVRQQVLGDAEASDHNSRAGSPLGTVIEGPIAGHEVHVAYPVVFPNPPIVRSELSPDVKGDVIIEVTIDSQGNVVETHVLEAIGHGIDEKIVATLRLWHYQPATLDGVPVASKHDVHFHFPS